MSYHIKSLRGLNALHIPRTFNGSLTENSPFHSVLGDFHTTWMIHLALQSFSLSTPSRPLFPLIPPKLLTSMATT